ncbi:MAG TPA: hypothetical protein VHU86_10040 [Solirubrobacterales bacterium]|jgi:hypothetical protein|nr:hypothetical protein [Solirubrobacterales bacterium]
MSFDPVSNAGQSRIAGIPITIGGIQVALGLIWLLDGALQFQSFMYSHAFLAEVIEPTALMQPGWVGQPILWASHLVGRDLALWNTLFALVQCAIGLGLIYRRTVKPALVLSFAWALVVWWFGEGFGMVLMNMGSPFVGSPGAVVLYAVVGVLVWPGGQGDRRSAVGAGALGDNGGRIAWSAVWLCSAALWVAALARPVYSISGALIEASGDSMPWLGGLQRSLATALSGDGKPIAAFLLVLSLAIAAGVWTRWRRETLLLGALLSLVYWTLGQSLGGLTTGSATDPNIGPLFLLLAVALWPAAVRSASAPSQAGLRLGRRQAA